MGKNTVTDDIGNRFDIKHTEREIGHLKSKIIEAFDKDVSQDEKIKTLISNNAELKLYLASMMRLLVTEEVITSEEPTVVVERLDA